MIQNSLDNMLCVPIERKDGTLTVLLAIPQLGLQRIATHDPAVFETSRLPECMRDRPINDIIITTLTADDIDFVNLKPQVPELIKHFTRGWQDMTCDSIPQQEAVEVKVRRFNLGQRVRKIRGSEWHGTVVGFYSTKLTPVGYCVESFTERGSVQIYPESALEMMEDDNESTSTAM